MHIPDSFMPISQGAVYWLIALVFIVLALRWVRNEMSEEKVPLVAILAAGVFALQAFNIPVTMGTSGHLLGEPWWRSCSGPRSPRSSSSPSF